MAFARITRLDHKLDTFMEINQMIVNDSCWIQRLDIGRISAVYNISLETSAVAPRGLIISGQQPVGPKSDQNNFFSAVDL